MIIVLSVVVGVVWGIINYSRNCNYNAVKILETVYKYEKL